MTGQELIDYYVGLLIAQYNTLAKARATVDACAGEVVAGQITTDVRDGYNLLTAVGLQLTVLAKYHGVIREVLGYDLSKAFFQVADYDDADPSIWNGFAAYGDSPTTYFAIYADALRNIFTLDDTQLRSLLLLMVQKHKLDMSLKDIDDLMYATFGTYVTIDETTMALEFTFTAGYPELATIAKYANGFPAPAGVTVTLTGLP